jgi:hypothetical protein
LTYQTLSFKAEDRKVSTAARALPLKFINSISAEQQVRRPATLIATAHLDLLGRPHSHFEGVSAQKALAAVSAALMPTWHVISVTMDAASIDVKRACAMPQDVGGDGLLPERLANEYPLFDGRFRGGA